jgi:hypothetical protein
MQNLAPTPVDPQESSPGAKDEAGLVDDGAAAYLSTIRLQRHVKAAELPPATSCSSATGHCTCARSTSVRKL